MSPQKGGAGGTHRDSFEQSREQETATTAAGSGEATEARARVVHSGKPRHASQRLGVVVVSYESGSVLPPLLSSLSEHERGVRVVIVDNASPSGPPTELATAHGADLMVLSENRGYGAACNVGVSRLLREEVDYLAFLNPDIRLTGPSLTELVDRLDERPHVGVASGPVVDETGRTVHSAFGPSSHLRALWFSSGWQSRRTRALITRLLRGGRFGSSTLEDDLRIEGHVLGGVMVVRTECFTMIDGFDEDYFLYWEDADVCERIRRAGAEVRIFDCSPFVHAPTTSTPGVDDDRRWEWYVQGAQTFASKHLPPGQARQLDAALSLGRKLRELRTDMRR